MHAEATKHVLLGRRSPGCPVAVRAAVGTTWGASKLGGLNITKCLQLRNLRPLESRLAGHRGKKPTRLLQGKADDAGEETGKCTLRYRRGRGPGILGRIRRDNVGKIPLAAGAGHNLQRLLKRGTTEGEKRGMGLAHESVRATKEGQRPLRRRATPPRRQVRAPWQRGSGHLAVSKPAGFPDTEPGYNHVRNETRLWANHERRSVCVPALKTSPSVGRLTGERPGFQTGPGKTGRPGL